SVAAEPHGIRHWLVPGCWFSITIGLLCAMAGGSPSPIPPAATKTDQMTPACLGCHIIFLLSTPARPQGVPGALDLARTRSQEAHEPPTRHKRSRQFGAECARARTRPRRFRFDRKLFF